MRSFEVVPVPELGCKNFLKRGTDPPKPLDSDPHTVLILISPAEKGFYAMPSESIMVLSKTNISNTMFSMNSYYISSSRKNKEITSSPPFVLA